MTTCHLMHPPNSGALSQLSLCHSGKDPLPPKCSGARLRVHGPPLCGTSLLQVRPSFVPHELRQQSHLGSYPSTYRVPSPDFPISDFPQRERPRSASAPQRFAYLGRPPLRCSSTSVLALTPSRLQ